VTVSNLSAMSPLPGSSRGVRRRADAERSVAAILDAAVRVFNERPAATVEEIARAAGVTRQTVYTHYPSRDALLGAVVDRITGEALAAIDTAAIDDGPPAAALVRLLDASGRTLDAYPLLLDHSVATASPQGSNTRRGPVAERFDWLIQRGQRTGDFDRRLSTTWLVAATTALRHAAAEEVSAKRITPEEATGALRTSVLRLLGADEEPR
jgi:AcrR family transcriptional regulator